VDDQFPVACVVEGYVNSPNATSRYIKHEYSFFEFRKIVEHKPELNVVTHLTSFIFAYYALKKLAKNWIKLPAEVYCEGRKELAQPQKLPTQFSLYQESVTKDYKGILTTHFFYSYPLRAIRVNSVNAKSRDDVAEVRIVQDFNSGVGYMIEKETNECTLFPIGSMDLDLYDETNIFTNYGTFTDLADADKLFKLDDTYYYAGQVYLFFLSQPSLSTGNV
jgi:hypothetical protein